MSFSVFYIFVMYQFYLNAHKGRLYNLFKISTFPDIIVNIIGIFGSQKLFHVMW